MFIIIINGLRLLFVFILLKFLAMDHLHFCVVFGGRLLHKRGLLFSIGNNLMTSLNDST